MINRVLKHLKNTSETCLQYSKLDMDSISLVVYTDYSFDNAAVHPSQIGYIICLVDALRRCSVLHFASRQSHFVARSRMAAETLAFEYEDPSMEVFDNAYY